MERVNCYNCGSYQCSYYDSENDFTLVKCDNCGLLYVNPRPFLQEIAKNAETGSYAGNKVSCFIGRFSQAKVRRYLAILREFYDKETLKRGNAGWLDVGCGHGEFIEALKIYASDKISVTGLEPNTEKRESARKRGLTVFSRESEACAGKYKYISLLNVFSHLAEPRKTLELLKGALEDGGEILIETGHSCHLPRKYHHRPYNLPDHLSFANQDIVAGMLKNLGFRIDKIKFYRCELFPNWYQHSIFWEIARLILGKSRDLVNFFSKYPNYDMWIKAHLELPNQNRI